LVAAVLTRKGDVNMKRFVGFVYFVILLIGVFLMGYSQGQQDTYEKINDDKTIQDVYNS
jgi:glucose uptake protein GlcU